MHKLKFLTLMAVLLSVNYTTLQAASLTLTPSANTAGIGEQILIDINMDFSDNPTLGGAIDIAYDETLFDYVSFSFDADFPTDPGFSSPGNAGDPLLSPGLIQSIGFGDFFTGLSGPYLVGTLTFTSISQGIGQFSISENVLPLGGFISLDGLSEIDPQMFNTSVAVVPVPASLLLFMSGLFGLIFKAKHLTRAK
ncbi:hypothetical protein MNBD_GAMMA06-2216 [hydrothermal vent metagenome]|uniref:Cohesin domain-containing protein n=1 Tax=hydrothermal vent metagenome TaxID=652676 RepID=A0A3B0WPY1_9ZZZZ